LGWQRHQLDHLQTICTSFQTDNHTNTPSLNIYRPKALPDAQPTVTRESSDPVTVFYNELQMSTYVADKRLQWARGLPVFIAVWTDFQKNIYLYIFSLGFFQKPENDSVTRT